ncbi:hypothetical protein IWQ62_003167 [Dispira parvispora]|uniref:RRM domain-containing protein n=1 Tax=Dispira parvispora TaxID=1520584 RepID=A0A9W8ARD5_9FUNG|nr:hypothetical protein IWQ62_003167 [Dispira parvispora]
MADQVDTAVEETKRVYIGGLSDQITETSLTSKLGSFGKVLGVELKKDNLTGIHRGFAYVNLQVTPQQWTRCVTVLNHTKWQGKTLSIQEAKRDPIKILEEERSTNKENTQDPADQPRRRKRPRGNIDGDKLIPGKLASNMTLMTDKEVEKRRGWGQGRYNRAIARMRLKKPDGTYFTFAAGNYRNNLTKLYGSGVPPPISQLPWDSPEPPTRDTKPSEQSHTKSATSGASWMDSWGEDDNEGTTDDDEIVSSESEFTSEEVASASSESESEAELEPEPKVKPTPTTQLPTDDPKQTSTTITAAQRKENSEMRRQEAMLKRAQEVRQAQDIVKQALAKVDNPDGNQSKIVFASDSEEGPAGHGNDDGVDMENRAPNTTNKKRLLLSDSEDDEDELQLRVNPMYEGKGGLERFNIQSSVGLDSRFTIDERFRDDDSSDNEVTPTAEPHSLNESASKSTSEEQSPVEDVATNLDTSQDKAVAMDVLRTMFGEIPESRAFVKDSQILLEEAMTQKQSESGVNGVVAPSQEQETRILENHKHYWRPVIHFDPDAPDAADLEEIPEATLAVPTSSDAATKSSFQNKPVPEVSQDRAVQIHGDLRSLFGKAAVEPSEDTEIIPEEPTFSLLANLGQTDTDPSTPPATDGPLPPNDRAPTTTADARPARLLWGPKPSRFDARQPPILATSFFFFHMGQKNLAKQLYFQDVPDQPTFATPDNMDELVSQWRESKKSWKQHFENRHRRVIKESKLKQNRALAANRHKFANNYTMATV